MSSVFPYKKNHPFYDPEHCDYAGCISVYNGLKAIFEGAGYPLSLCEKAALEKAVTLYNDYTGAGVVV
jgi:hypothetical protein